MVRLQREAIELDAVLRLVASGSAGAIDIFVGTTRDNADRRSVRSLEYEAHEAMALKEMERITAEADRRWKLTGVAVVHRTGRVLVGEASVAIAVSAPHRAEAFEACRFIIDTLKQTVPIWKKEEFADGTTEWSGLGSANPPSH
ncbi:MAG: molybdenum cofactor biosynthesis protein MoaE [Bacteroidetes bacterium]|jgi:molybdopterin synthase catalytic subunit|nr:molybdenum cofactor biosynthesis protein MoaE [Bacteroidota bacterium]